MSNLRGADHQINPYKMASFATKTQQQQQQLPTPKTNYHHTNNHPPPAPHHQMSILAQAKPAIISTATANMNDYSTGILSEKIQAALKFQEEEERPFLAKDLNEMFCNQKMKHIEDDNVIQRQNASNQMRQNAVMMAGLAAAQPNPQQHQQQQQKRLSATERLAMTAKITSQQHQRQHQQLAPKPLENGCSNKQQQQSTLPQPPPSLPAHQTGPKPAVQAQTNKPAPMPTLETLLAVQRQLQRHTKQNLNSTVPQDLVRSRDQQVSFNTTTNGKQQSKPCTNNKKGESHEITTHTSYADHQNINVTSIDTYDKDLPPLPASVSPSTCTDSSESQLNSLESHQSSPATSLVSLPPPPPPISSYLQQYDEVNSSGRQSNSSSPSTISSSASSDVSSIRTLPIKQQLNECLQSITERHQRSQSSSNFAHHQEQNRGVNSASQNTCSEKQPKASPPPPPLAPRPTNLAQFVAQDQRPTVATSEPQQSRKVNQAPPAQPPPLPPAPSTVATISQHSPLHVAGQLSSWSQHSPATTISENADNDISQQSPQHQHQHQQSFTPGLSFNGNKPAMINYQQHVFNPTAAMTTSSEPASSSMFMPPPPPPLLTSTPSSPKTTASSDQIPTPTSASNSSSGFDEPDCGSFRFPTPPPPALMLDEDGDDEDIDLKSEMLKKEQLFFQEHHHNQQEDEDEDFQCRIPTPPAHKSMSAASFQDLKHQSTFTTSSFNLNQHLSHRKQVDCETSSEASSSSTMFGSSTFSVPMQSSSLSSVKKVSTTTGYIQPPPLFRQPNHVPNIRTTNSTNHQALQPLKQITTTNATNNNAPQLTVRVSDHHDGLLSTTTTSTTTNASNLKHQAHLNQQHQHQQQAVNHHHHIMMSMAASSPSSSSDGDGHSSNSSSSTSGIHSSIDSPSSSNSKLDDFNYSSCNNSSNRQHQPSFQMQANICKQTSKLHHHQQQHQHQTRLTSIVDSKSTRKNSSSSLSSTTGLTQHQQPQQPHQPFHKPPSPLTTNNSVTNVPATTATSTTSMKPRPALKQKKTVSFSDKVELVACAEEQTVEHLPNPLLARVLARKMQ